MANSFLSKVSFERRVLTVVNAQFRGTQQLAGLSRSSIELWQRTVSARVSKDIVANLLVLAELCQSLSDRSHESFKSLNPAVEERLGEELRALEMAVEQIRRKG